MERLVRGKINLSKCGHEARDLPVVLTVEIRPVVNQQLHHVEMTSWIIAWWHEA